MTRHRTLWPLPRPPRIDDEWLGLIPELLREELPATTPLAPDPTLAAGGMETHRLTLHPGEALVCAVAGGGKIEITAPGLIASHCPARPGWIHIVYPAANLVRLAGTTGSLTCWLTLHLASEPVYLVRRPPSGPHPTVAPCG